MNAGKAWNPASDQNHFKMRRPKNLLQIYYFWSSEYDVYCYAVVKDSKVLVVICFWIRVSNQAIFTNISKSRGITKYTHWWKAEKILFIAVKRSHFCCCVEKTNSGLKNDPREVPFISSVLVAFKFGVSKGKISENVLAWIHNRQTQLSYSCKHYRFSEHMVGRKFLSLQAKWRKTKRITSL